VLLEVSDMKAGWDEIERQRLWQRFRSDGNAAVAGVSGGQKSTRIRVKKTDGKTAGAAVLS